MTYDESTNAASASIASAPSGAAPAADPLASDTGQRILDVAERLFAAEGIDRVSVRRVQAQAGVNVAAVHYHFGTREALVRAVLRRRVEPLNAARLAALDEVLAASGNASPTLEAVLGAFIRPVFALADELPHVGWLLAHVYVTPDEALRQFFYELFAPLVERFALALGAALGSSLPIEVAWCRVQFTWGAMIHALSKERRNRTLGPAAALPAELAADDLAREWIAFCAAGLRAPAAARLGAVPASEAASSPATTTQTNEEDPP